MSNPAESELVETFQTHREGLAGAVRSILGAGADVSGIVQDAFVRALQALRRGERPADQAAWVFVITMNLAKDQRRRRQIRRPERSIEETDMEFRTSEPAPGRRAESKEAMAAARAAIGRLSDPEKEVFMLRAAGELTFEAAAEALGIPVGTAKTRMRSALQRLRGELAPFAPDTRRPS